ncbi:tRNA lysidine(34) synthetase TilS [bacterium]|nr:MAG: tRNA lysidine(34) synthetase TilS [bacterium]
MSKSAWNHILSEVSAALPPDSLSKTWVLAVSGGADSVCLLRALHALNIPIVVAHVNYWKRGVESENDQQFVEQLAARLDIPFETLRAPKHSKGNFQEWARHIRYDFFDEVKTNYRADFIGIAHHQNDQQETRLFRWLRGSSAKSRLGMSVFNPPYVRPLLGLTRTEIEDGLREIGQTWRDDVSNFETHYSRNKIRHDFIPKLNEVISDWDKTLQNTAELEYQLTQHFFEQTKAFVEQSTDSLWVKNEFFERIPECIQTDVLHLYLDEMGKTSVSLSSLRHASLLFHHQKGRRVSLLPDFEAFREENGLLFTSSKKSTSLFKRLNSIDDLQKLYPLDYTFEFITDLPKKWIQDGSLYLDFSLVSFPLQLRTWKSGDVFQPLGMSGHKLVSDFLTDAKIPTHIRNDIFVLSNFDGLIHAVIFAPPFSQNNRVAEQVKCTKSSTRILRIFPNNQI